MIQYINEELHGDLNTLKFIYGETAEDRYYNEYALSQADIVDYVNSRISQQDNTVIL